MAAEYSFVLLIVTASPNPNPNTRTGGPGPGLVGHLLLPHEASHPFSLLDLVKICIWTISPPWATSHLQKNGTVIIDIAEMKKYIFVLSRTIIAQTKLWPTVT